MENIADRPKLKLIICTSIILLITGCTSSQIRNRNLKRVAKDWCMTIRASQVIPIYPLSEDLQPGDVLLVTTPVEEQAKTYEKSGFLALDQHLLRIPLDAEYREFYTNRYGVVNQPPSLQAWKLRDGTTNHNWKIAPASAFPSYSFEVETGAKGSMAIPIEGVPFAMSFMNASKSEGTITISDTHTYGLSIATLYQKLEKWAADNQSLLQGYAPVKKTNSIWRNDPVYKRSYLRVVTRVHLAKEINVSLKSNNTFKAMGAGGADGKKRSAAENLLTSTNAAPNYTSQDGAVSNNTGTQMTNLTQLVSSMVPGGNTTVNTFSSQSINMNQSFPKPLVIGYIGFDIPILKGGKLGTPISTLDQLNAIKPFNDDTEKMKQSLKESKTDAEFKNSLYEITNTNAQHKIIAYYNSHGNTPVDATNYTAAIDQLVGFNVKKFSEFKAWYEEHVIKEKNNGTEN